MDESSNSENEIRFIEAFCKVVDTPKNILDFKSVYIDPRVELPIYYSICLKKAWIPYIHNPIKTDDCIDGELTLQFSPVFPQNQREYFTKVFQLLFTDFKVEELDASNDINYYAYFGYIGKPEEYVDPFDTPTPSVEYPVMPKPPVIDSISDQYEYYISKFYAKKEELILPQFINDYEISINDKMDLHDILNHLIRSSNINYTFYRCPRDIHQGYRNSLCFDWQTDIGIIKYISSIFKILFIESPWAKESFQMLGNGANPYPKQFLKIYIAYGKVIEGKSNIYFGPLHHQVTNISKWLSYEEIQNIDVNSFAKDKWLKLYPPIKLNHSGLYNPCYKYEIYPRSTYEEYKTRSRYTQYGGYNGWSDQDINDAFDGRPDATWNVD